MGLFNVIGKTFGKKRVLNKPQSQPFDIFRDPTLDPKVKLPREAKEAMSALEARFPGITRRKIESRQVSPSREEEAYRILEDLERREREQGVELQTDPEFGFMEMGEPIVVTNSNHVAWLQFIHAESLLYVGYLNGWVYAYTPISASEGREFFMVAYSGKRSVGKEVVWGRLRRKGSAFGHQKDYTFVRSEQGSLSLQPKYKEKMNWAFEHLGIPESGMPPESWIRGEGPYGEDVTPFKPRWY